MLNDTKKTIIFLVVGVFIAVGSFLSYYLIEPKNWEVISIFCVIDFLYLLLNAYALVEEVSSDAKRHLVAWGISLGYIAVFNLVPIIFMLLKKGGGWALISKMWKSVLLYSFFTGPCLLIIIVIVMLLLWALQYA